MDKFIHCLPYAQAIVYLLKQVLGFEYKPAVRDSGLDLRNV